MKGSSPSSQNLQLNHVFSHLTHFTASDLFISLHVTREKLIVAPLVKKIFVFVELEDSLPYDILDMMVVEIQTVGL
jgi:hypothetical protein